MVKPGYKQTEIGVIPEDWDIVKLIELSDGGMQNGVFYAVDRKGKGVRFLNVGNLYGTAPITPQTLERFDATKEEINRFRIKSGDLFFTRSSIVPSGIAYCNWYKDVDGYVTVFDSHVVRFKTDTDKVNPMYLYLQCISHSARKYFVSNAKVATMTTIDQTQIGNCLVPIPSSFTEQRRIAQSISDIDNLIVVYEKLLRKKKAIKQGVMQELLTGKKRLPGFADKWIKRTIGDIACIESGGTPSTTVGSYWNGKISWCTPTDITENRSKYIRNTEKTITKEGVLNSSAKLLPKGTILLCTRATIGESSIASDVITTNQGFKNLICNDDVYNEFLYYALQMKKIEMLSLAIGSTFLEISKNALSGILIDLPDNRDEQVAIASVLSDIDEEIELLEQKLAKYRQLKQGMMQQLLTGRIRLV